MVLARTQPAAGIYLPFRSLDTYISLPVLLIIFPCLKRSVYGRSVADHLEYYGVTLHADSRGTCQFVIGATNSAYSNILEVDGTIILSRYPQELHAVESI